MKGSPYNYMNTIRHTTNLIKKTESQGVTPAFSKQFKDDLKDSSQKKKRNYKVLKAMERKQLQLGITDKTIERVAGCCSVKRFAHGKYQTFNEDGSPKDPKECWKVVETFYCGNKYCPVCSKRKAYKQAFQLQALTEHIRLTHNNKFIMVTLTAPNVHGSDLKAELREYAVAFNIFIKNTAIKNSTTGYMRKLEVTYNKETNTYHPHYHVLFSVKPSYFGTGYIKRSEWLEYWRTAKKDRSITQVDVRRVHTEIDPKGIAELSKYISKDADYLENDEVFATFYKALKGARNFSYGGLFKEAVKLYKAGELNYLIATITPQYLYASEFAFDEQTKKYKLERCGEISHELRELLENGIQDDKGNVTTPPLSISYFPSLEFLQKDIGKNINEQVND